MAKKHPNSQRIGGPGAAHENRKQPEKSQPRGEHPADTKSPRHSAVSGGGGETDSHHGHRPQAKAEKTSPNPTVRQSEFPVSRRGMNQESDHNKHNDPSQSGHEPQPHSPAEQKQD